MIKALRKLSAALVLAALLAGAAGAAVQAHETVDLERSDCSLTVVMKYDGKPVAGGSLTLYRVGNITENNGEFGFELRPELDCNPDMSEKAAKEVCACVERQNLPGAAVDIDAEGIAVFSDLAVGLYLIRQETAAPGFEPIKPFLISVPRWDGGHYIYNVAAAAKTELHKLPAPPPGPPPGPKLPQTGQLNWPVPALLMLGGLLLVAGLEMRRKNDA